MGHGFLVQVEEQLLEFIADERRSDDLGEVLLEAWDAVIELRARREPPPLNLSPSPCDSGGDGDGSRDMPAAGDRGAADGGSAGGTSVAWPEGWLERGTP